YITLYGKGEQSRSFCYVDDLVEVITRMMNSPDDFVGPVNIGNPTEFTIKQLAELTVQLVGEVTGKPAKSKVVYKPMPADDPAQRQPDISLAKSKLGWEPRVPLREGLKK